MEKDRLYNIMALGKEKEVLVTDVASDDMESDTEPIDRFEEGSIVSIKCVAYTSHICSSPRDS